MAELVHLVYERDDQKVIIPVSTLFRERSSRVPPKAEKTKLRLV